MNQTKLPTGSFVRIEKPDLQKVIDQLRANAYRVIGPRVADAAIVYGDLESIEQLPVGIVDEQDGGTYRLAQHGDAYFDYVVGPHSLKNFLFPPRETLVEGVREEGGWKFSVSDVKDDPLAIIGPRACDLQAMAIQDRVFLSGDYVDPAYKIRRENLFLVAVNCRRAAGTCFCHSMNSGPAVTANFDLALTELDDFFALEIGTEAGGNVMTAIAWTLCSIAEINAVRAVPADLEKKMHDRSDGRHMDTHGIRDLLMQNLEHPRWQQVAERCLSCANCTMVCPTCFCVSIEEVSDLSNEHVRRDRTWESCFNAEHSQMNSGTVRKTTRSRYRQWLTHKLATWHDQFDTSGCTGCGRCITWCPVGIDLTEEVAAIRQDDQRGGH